MTFSQRLEEIRTGFERPFWIANISELFERLSYYAVFAVLARYLHEGLHFDRPSATSSLTGMFGGWVWFLAVIGGAVADRLGFRRALSVAYLILSVAYFLMGSIGSPWLVPLRSAVPLVGVVAFILILARAGRLPGQTLCGWDHGSRIQRKCSLRWLLHLLHAGQCRQHGRTVAVLRGRTNTVRGKRFSHRGA